jgi:hypothetical protein
MKLLVTGAAGFTLKMETCDIQAGFTAKTETNNFNL